MFFFVFFYLHTFCCLFYYFCIFSIVVVVVFMIFYFAVFYGLLLYWVNCEIFLFNFYFWENKICRNCYVFYNLCLILISDQWEVYKFNFNFRFINSSSKSLHITKNLNQFIESIFVLISVKDFNIDFIFR